MKIEYTNIDAKGLFPMASGEWQGSSLSLSFFVFQERGNYYAKR